VCGRVWAHQRAQPQCEAMRERGVGGTGHECTCHRHEVRPQSVLHLPQRHVLGDNRRQRVPVLAYHIVHLCPIASLRSASCIVADTSGVIWTASELKRRLLRWDRLKHQRVSSSHNPSAACQRPLSPCTYMARAFPTEPGKLRGKTQIVRVARAHATGPFECIRLGTPTNRVRSARQAD
jgi:hypothetical protein